MNLKQTTPQKTQLKNIHKRVNSIKFNDHGHIEFPKKIKKLYRNNQKKIVVEDEEGNEYIVENSMPEQSHVTIHDTANGTYVSKMVPSDSEVILDTVQQVGHATEKLHGPVAVTALGIGIAAAMVAALTTRKANPIFDTNDKKDNKDKKDNLVNPDPSVSKSKDDKDEISKDKSQADKENKNPTDEQSKKEEKVEEPNEALKPPVDGNDQMHYKPPAKLADQLEKDKNKDLDVLDKNDNNFELNKDDSKKIDQKDFDRNNVFITNPNIKIPGLDKIPETNNNLLDKNYSEEIVLDLSDIVIDIAGNYSSKDKIEPTKQLLTELIKNDRFSRKEIKDSLKEYPKFVADRIASDEDLSKLFNELFEAYKDKLVGEDKLFNEAEYQKIVKTSDPEIENKSGDEDELDNNDPENKDQAEKENDDNELPVDNLFLEKLDKAVLNATKENFGCEAVTLLNNLFEGKHSYTQNDKDNELRLKVIKSILSIPELILSLNKMNVLWKTNLNKLVGSDKLFTEEEWAKIVSKNESQSFNNEENSNKEEKMSEVTETKKSTNEEISKAFLETCKKMFDLKDLSQPDPEKEEKPGVGDQGEVTEGKKEQEKPGEVTEGNKEQEKPDEVTEGNKEQEKSGEVAEGNKEQEKPGEVAEGNKEQEKPGEVTEGNKEQEKPGEVAEGNKEQEKPGEVTEGNKEQEKPDEVTEGNKEQEKPGEVTEGNKEQEKPGEVTEGNKEQEKSGEVAEGNKDEEKPKIVPNPGNNPTIGGNVSNIDELDEKNKQPQRKAELDLDNIGKGTDDQQNPVEKKVSPDELVKMYKELPLEDQKKAHDLLHEIEEQQAKNDLEKIRDENKELVKSEVEKLYFDSILPAMASATKEKVGNADSKTMKKIITINDQIMGDYKTLSEEAKGLIDDIKHEQDEISASLKSFPSYNILQSDIKNLKDIVNKCATSAKPVNTGDVNSNLNMVNPDLKLFANGADKKGNMLNSQSAYDYASQNYDSDVSTLSNF